MAENEVVFLALNEEAFVIRILQIGFWSMSWNVKENVWHKIEAGELQKESLKRNCTFDFEAKIHICV